MSADFDRLRELFHAVVGHPPESREAFLDQACGPDRELRRQVGLLLHAHAQGGGLLDRAAPGTAHTGVYQSRDETPGTTVGPYKLVERLGEGGMGTVWMAQQTQPVKRLVALKVIKAGLDYGQVVARFEAERQALALMDHPNIARVLDGGTTEGEPGCVSAGRPYFVMELVKGVPITTYCDQRRLTPRQRLELMIPVCQGVQHAHQKGVIHRDLKPANVLVALYDGQPVPKVIDFGIAKATGQQLTEKTLVTGFGAVVGTLEYMSPEQAQLNQLDIDTRSDIYSLGVILYELLTGTPPLDRQRLKEATLLEVLRLIREEEPPTPSARLSTTAELPRIAANRGLEPGRLSGLLRGEPDWIIMKCLEKDRQRRYETANALALDLRRYLHDEPVLACPPSAGYRLRKFIRRNKAALATGGVITLAVLLAVALSTWRIWLAKVDAETARDVAQEERDLSDANLRLADEVLEQLYLQMAEKDLPRNPQREKENLALLQAALRFYSRFAEKNAANPRVRFQAGKAYVRAGVLLKLLGRHDEAEQVLARGIDLLEQEPADLPRWPDARQQLGHAYNERGTLLRADFRFAEAEAAFRQARAVHEDLVAHDPRSPVYRHDLSASCGNLAEVLKELGRLEESERVFQMSQELAEQLVREDANSADDRTSLAHSLNQRAVGQRERGDLEGALKLHRRAVHHQAIAVKLAHTDPRCRLRLGAWSGNLAETLQAMRDHEGALQASERQRALAAQLVKEYPRVPDYVHELILSRSRQADALEALGRVGEARKAYQEVLPLMTDLARDYGARPLYRRNLVALHRRRAEVLAKTGQVEVAEAAYRQALALHNGLPQALRSTAGHRAARADIHLDLGELLTKSDRFAESEKVLREAVKAFQDLDREFPGRAAYRRGLARAHSRLASLFLAARQPEKAEGPIREALVLQRKLAHDHPKVPRYRAGLARTLNSRGYQHWKAGRFKEAEPDYQEALALRTRLAKESPGDFVHRRNAAASQYNLALLYQTSDRLAQAEEAYRKARQIQEKLVARVPDLAELHTELAGTVNNQGMMQLQRGELAAARSSFEQALRHQRDALKRSPDLPRYRRNLARACLNLADVLVKIGDHAALARVAEELAGVDWIASAQAADYPITCAALAGKDARVSPAQRLALARAYADQASALLRKAARLCPDTSRDQMSLREHYTSAARRLSQGGWKPQAIEALRQSIAIGEKYRGQFADANAYRVGLSGQLKRLSSLLHDTGQLQEAEEAYGKAVAALEKLVEDCPDQHTHKSALGLVLNDLALLLRDRGRPAEARTRLQQALEYQRQALELDRGNSKYRQGLVGHHANLAQTLLGLGDHAGAARAAHDYAGVLPDWRIYRSAATLLGWCLPLAEKDARLSEKERQALVRNYIDQARALLRKANRVLPDDPAAQNELARFLVTWEEPRLHDAPLAVKLAQKATQRAQKVAVVWNTLGIALYRAGEWQAAVPALERSVKLGGGASDHFVLAMAYWQLAAKNPGHRKTAQEWFRRGTLWMAEQEQAPKRNEPSAAQLRRLQTEAAALLGTK